MKTRLAIRPEIAHARHDEWEKRREKFLQVVADEEIFLTWLADNRRRIDRIAAMKDCLDVEDRIIVLQRVVTVMIAERSFGSALVRRNMTDQSKLCFRNEPVSCAERILRHPDTLACEH